MQSVISMEDGNRCRKVVVDADSCIIYAIVLRDDLVGHMRYATLSLVMMMAGRRIIVEGTGDDGGIDGSTTKAEAASC